jgi:hypothetical protein
MKFYGRAMGAMALAAVLALGAAACKDKKTTTPKVDSPVWIVVNGKNITKAEIDRGLSYITKELDPETAASRANEIKRYVMEAEVRMALLDEEVAKEKLTLPQGELDKQMQTVKQNFQTPAEYNQWVTERWGTSAEFVKASGTSSTARSSTKRSWSPTPPTRKSRNSTSRSSP